MRARRPHWESGTYTPQCCTVGGFFFWCFSCSSLADNSHRFPPDKEPWSAYTACELVVSYECPVGHVSYSNATTWSCTHPFATTLLHRQMSIFFSFCVVYFAEILLDCHYLTLPPINDKMTTLTNAMTTTMMRLATATADGRCSSDVAVVLSRKLRRYLFVYLIV